MNKALISATDDEIDLLDLLVIAAESWKLLIIGPVLIATATLMGSIVLKPNLYQSTAILRLADDQGVLLHSTVVLDPLAESFGYLSEAKGIQEDAREKLKSDLVSAVDKRTKLLTITATSTSAEKAQKLNEQAIELLLNELTPKGQDRTNILQQIEIRKQAISAAQTSFEQLTQTVSIRSARALSIEQSPHAFVALVTLILDNKKTIQELEQQLLVKGPEVFVQNPTFPQKPMPNNHAMMLVITAFASGIVLLLFVFIRKALIKAGTNPESAKKIEKIKHSFSITSRAT